MGPNNAEGAIAPNRDSGAAGLAPGGLAARAAGGTEQEQGPPLAGGGAARGQNPKPPFPNVKAPFYVAKPPFH